jgi:ribose/xylose/arabinose/galactoside ABC-type transport system permease subunit
MRNITKVFGAVAVAGVVAAGGSAFTATSGIDSSQKYVGAVSQAISGVNVNNVQYTTDGATDTTTAVDFGVAEVLAAGDTVSAALNNGTPVVCTKTPVPATGTQTSTHLACDFGAGVVNVTSLSIVAS